MQQKTEITEEEIKKMKEDFDKNLKKFHEKAVPDILETVKDYTPMSALFGLGAIVNAIISQQFNNDPELREQFMMYLQSSTIEEATSDS